MSILKEPYGKTVSLSTNENQELMKKFGNVKVSTETANNIKDGDDIQVGSVSAHLTGSTDPMYLFERTRVARAVLFIIGIRRQEMAWDLPIS